MLKKAHNITDRFKNALIDKGMDENTAVEILKERRQLQKECFQGNAEMVLDKNSHPARRLAQINHMIFEAKTIEAAPLIDRINEQKLIMAKNILDDHIGRQNNSNLKSAWGHVKRCL